MDRSITRRDFLNSAVLGTGAVLLGQHAPLLAGGSAPPDSAGFDGYSGVGDYVGVNGNTWQVLQDAHALRDGAFKHPVPVIDTGELFDIVVVGGGFAGIGAAHRVKELGEGRKTCLVLDNHRLWGGEARRNEFLVDGVRLYAPQGSNECSIRAADMSPLKKAMFEELGVPLGAAYSELSGQHKTLQASHSNYVFHLWGDNFESHGFYFPEAKRWVTNPWGHDLAGVPWPDRVKQDLLRWRHDRKHYYTGPRSEAMERWLDSMTYEQYVTQVMGLGSEVARYADPILAAAFGLASDSLSAYVGWTSGMPGFQGLQADHAAHDNYRLDALNAHVHRFPGGNDALMRGFIKRLIPDAIEGGGDFASVHNGAIRTAALDRPGQATRIRLSSTAVAVEHEGAYDKAERVAITYLRDGRLYRVRARSVVVASGAWSAKHSVKGLPVAHQQALGRFHRQPMLIINVALTNWRALYRLGYTAATWRGGSLGFSFNLSPPMQVGSYAPAFDPDRPAVLTYYVPFVKNGLSIEQQGPAGRAELLSTSYRDYERLVRAQLTEMLGPHGFNARRDIAGIILNRWGHAYVGPYAGFHFGRDGVPSPSETLRQPVGRIAFGHSELRGHQYWIGAVGEGRRAVEQVLA